MFLRSPSSRSVPIVANTGAIVIPAAEDQLDLSVVDAAIVASLVAGAATGIRHDIYGICRVPDPTGGATPQIVLLRSFANLEAVETPVKYVFTIGSKTAGGTDDMPIGAVYFGFAIVQTSTGAPTAAAATLKNV